MNHFATMPDQNEELLAQRGVSRSGQELSMQAVVERVMRAFAIKHPSDEKAETARRNAAELAAELLDNYRIRIAQRDRLSHTH
ncbi:MAG: hypothetical protein J0H40_02250 [Rhizobiales bacterium]|nr:hypothetical protein [Hyphomicrobiales bacterium]